MRGKRMAFAKEPVSYTNTEIDHIESFPPFESHYTRLQNPKRKHR